MHKQFYFLSPVEVVKVTSNNLQEVAEWCGGRVSEAESNRVKGRMDKYVWVPTPKGSNISWAFPGMFITKRLVVNMKGELKATLAVFSRDYFEKNYFESPKDAVDKTWEIESKQRLAEEAKKALEKKKPKSPAEFASDHERRRNIKINVGEGAQPGEPVAPPPLTTEEAEQMDEESLARVEQVNREILGLHRHTGTFAGVEHTAVGNPGAVFTNDGPPIGKVRVFQKGSDVYVDMSLDEAKAAGVLIDLPGDKLITAAGSNQPSPAHQRMEAREAEVEAMDKAVELVEKELGGVEVITPSDIVQAFVHDHDLEETCDNGTCVERGDFRFHDGLHVFNDTAVEASPEGWIKVDMPAAYSEIKL